MKNNALLEIQGLSVKFSMYNERLTKYNQEIISDLNVTIHKGEILAVIGSSGSGKSILAHAILGILPDNAIIKGKIKYCGDEITPQYQEELRGKEIAFIPQSVAYLDPLMRIGKQVQGDKGNKKMQEEVFKRYHLNEKVEKMFPFQLSGGMARRALIATATTAEAKLIIADEPTPGLNAEIAAEAMQNFRELAAKGCAVMLITHDIDLALSIADRIAVFYAGTVVETAPASDFIKGKEALRHPYSKALWEALPQNGFKPISRGQPYASSLPSGCLFRERCEYDTEACQGKIEMRTIRGGEVRCVYAF